MKININDQVSTAAFMELARLKGAPVDKCKTFCSRCQTDQEFRYIRKKYIYQIHCLKCKKYIPVLKETVFFNLSMPLAVYVKGIYILKVTERRITAKKLASELNIGLIAARRLKAKASPITSESIEFKVLIAVRELIKNHYNDITNAEDVRKKNNIINKKMKKSENIKLNLGEATKWRSESSSIAKEKHGTVVYIVRAGINPLDDKIREQINPGWLRREAQHHEAFGGGMARDHESYVILVPSKSGCGKSTLYWPRIKHLQKIAEERS